jgi:serine/threonine-protein kinase
LAHYVGGRYQLIAQLGGGGMADVYLAKMSGKADFAKLAVVKRLKTFEDDDPEILRMFADEARLCARLNHPNIVQTFEVGEDTTGPFLVMEYLEGQPLSRIRSRAGRRDMTIPRAISMEILRDTLAGLSYAHGLIDHDGTPLRVVHRDVSPENIMVTYAGQTKLVDFGVAKTVASMSRTRAGVLKGKVAYMAPEQARSDTTIDERADVFAAGLLLWEMLTNKRLWEGLSEAKVFERLLDEEPLPRARTVDPEIPEELDELCAKAMEKDKENRFASASDLLDALEKACAKYDLRASKREIGQFVIGLFEAEREKVRTLVSNAVAKSKEVAAAAAAAEAFFLPRPNTSLEPAQPAAKAEPAKAEPAPPAQAEPAKAEPAPPAEPPGSAKLEGLTSTPLEAAPPAREESDPFLFHPISSGLLPSAADSGRDTSDSSQSSKTTAGVVEATPRPTAPAAGTSKARLLMGATVVLGLVGGALFVGKRLGAPNASPDAPVTTVVMQAPPPPSTRVTAEAPPEVAIDISVKPSSAKLYIDGKLATNPYHLTTPRADGAHEIRAEAEGYETRTMSLAWDRDRVLEMTLAKRAPEPPSAPTVAIGPPQKVNGATPKAPVAHATSPTHAGTSATASRPSPTRGISEIEPSSPKRSEKQDKIDTDVFRR